MNQKAGTHTESEKGTDAAASSALLAEGRSGGRLLTVLLLLLVLAEMLAVALSHAFVMPRFLTVLEDFDSSMPALTLFYVDLPIPLVLGVLFIWAVGLIVAEATVRPFIPRVLVHVLSLLLVGVAAIVMIFALFLPMVGLIKSTV